MLAPLESLVPRKSLLARADRCRSTEAGVDTPSASGRSLGSALRSHYPSYVLALADGALIRRDAGVNPARSRLQSADERSFRPVRIPALIAALCRCLASGAARAQAESPEPFTTALRASNIPLAGVDGNMNWRNGAAGNAHIKSGLLVDVHAIAGCGHARSGRRYMVVSMISRPQAGDGQPAHDALPESVFGHG